MICFNDIYKAYEKHVFSNFSLCLEEEISTALLGPSGCGKTTLINMLLGFEKPDKGSISNAKDKSFSVVFQENRLLEGFTVKENAMVSCRDENKCMEVLEFLDMADAADFYINELSGGMKRRTAIARCLLKKADIYLFDEPFKGIDEALKKNIISSMKEYLKGRTCLLVTHDINEAIQMCDWIKIMDKNPAEIIRSLHFSEINAEFINNFNKGII